MSPTTVYYEVGFETKHVKLAVKIPDLRSSKLKLRKKMKKSKVGLRKGRTVTRSKRQIIDTSSLASINVDWKQEFEEKYKDLITKTQKKNQINTAAMKEKFQEEIKNISLIANTSMLKEDEEEEKDVNLSNLNDTNVNNNSVFETTENRNLLKPCRSKSLRYLKYRYHILKQ